MAIIINNRQFKNDKLEDRSSSDRDSCRIQDVLLELGFNNRGMLKTDTTSEVTAINCWNCQSGQFNIDS